MGGLKGLPVEMVEAGPNILGLEGLVEDVLLDLEQLFLPLRLALAVAGVFEP
jgi:hypothetical protein